MTYRSAPVVTKDEAKALDRIADKIEVMEQNQAVVMTQMAALVEQSRVNRLWDLVDRGARSYGNLMFTNTATKLVSGVLWTIIFGMLIIGTAARWFDIDVSAAFDGMRQAKELTTEIVEPLRGD